MLWPKVMAGVVRLARIPTTPRWLPPALPLLIQGGELCLVRMSPWIEAANRRPRPRNRLFNKHEDGNENDHSFFFTLSVPVSPKIVALYVQ